MSRGIRRIYSRRLTMYRCGTQVELRVNKPRVYPGMTVFWVANDALESHSVHHGQIKTRREQFSRPRVPIHDQTLRARALRPLTRETNRNIPTRNISYRLSAMHFPRKYYEHLFLRPAAYRSPKTHRCTVSSPFPVALFHQLARTSTILFLSVS